MSEIIEFLITVRDERDNWKIKHSLADIVLLIFFARLSGAEFWEEIEDFGNIYETSLRSVLTLENGIPSHDTLQRVFATLDAQVLVEVTLMWNDILREADLSAKTFPSFAKRLLAIDGKTIKGNSSQTQKALHIVSAYATDLGICYGQVATDDKSNEITAIPDLLDKISVKGCLISIDAMGTQTAIANKIIKKQADKDAKPHFVPDTKHATEAVKKTATYQLAGVKEAQVKTTIKRYVWKSKTAKLLYGFGGESGELVSQKSVVQVPKDTWLVLSKEQSEKLPDIAKKMQAQLATDPAKAQATQELAKSNPQAYAEMQVKALKQALNIKE